MDNKTLLDVAAMLVKMAGESKPVNPKEAEIVAVWMEMVRQAQERTKPHAWVDLKPGTPYWETGDNTQESPFYEKFKNFWQAMERERVLDQYGSTFNSVGIRRDGRGWKAFEDAIKFMAKTPQGTAWFNDPRNQNYLPKPQDMMLLF